MALKISSRQNLMLSSHDRYLNNDSWVHFIIFFSNSEQDLFDLDAVHLIFNEYLTYLR